MPFVCVYIAHALVYILRYQYQDRIIQWAEHCKNFWPWSKTMPLVSRFVKLASRSHRVLRNKASAIKKKIFLWKIFIMENNPAICRSSISVWNGRNLIFSYALKLKYIQWKRMSAKTWTNTGEKDNSQTDDNNVTAKLSEIHLLRGN